MPRCPNRWSLAVIVSLVGHLAGAVGLPLPSGAPRAPRTHKCGCPADGPAGGCCCGPAGACCGVAPAPEEGWHWAPGLWAMRCRGLVSIWLDGDTSLPPPPAIRWSPGLVGTGRAAAPPSLAVSHPWPVPEPPPRCAAA